jgi:hypothetical protein
MAQVVSGLAILNSQQVSFAEKNTDTMEDNNNNNFEFTISEEIFFLDWLGSSTIYAFNTVDAQTLAIRFSFLLFWPQAKEIEPLTFPAPMKNP